MNLQPTKKTDSKTVDATFYSIYRLFIDILNRSQDFGIVYLKGSNKFQVREEIKVTQRRFFVSKAAIEGDLAQITGADAHHLRNVLRLEIGEEIIIVAEGQEYQAEISDFQADKVLCALKEVAIGQGEPPLKVILLQGLPKGEKVELIIQKAVEIGVTKIVLLDTARCVVKLDSARAEKRLVRWQRIALEAAKQCRRSIVPQVDGIYKLPQWLKEQKLEDTLFLVPWEEEKQIGLREVLTHSNVGRVILLIGPEGGLAEEEVELAKEYGAKPVTLGPRILRTETAAIVAAALVLYQLGDLN